MAPFFAMEVSLEQIQKKRFVWGAALVWGPLVFLYIFGLRNTFRGIAASKATGVGAVAGGLTEAFAILGFGAMLLFQVSAFVLLARSFSKGHLGRNVVTVVSLSCCGITLLMLAGYVSIWLHFRQ
jgi:hypothetical protein